MVPDRSTSTPNSVPRSVTMAVGVRTAKGIRDEGFGIWDFGFRISDFGLLTLLHSRRQLAQREEAAGGGIDFVGARALEDDFCPACHR